MVVGRNQELIDLLKQQENILCALEISDTIEDVKNDLRLSFWERIHADLKSGLMESGLVTGWVVGGLDDLKRDPTRSDKGVYLTSIDTPVDAIQLRLGVWQDPMVYYGIGFSKEQPDPHPLNELAELWTALADEHEWSSRKPDHWWLCWRYLDTSTNSREFFFASASSPLALTKPATDAVIDLA